MAPSLFQGNRIRDHKAHRFLGKPLVYGIGTSDPKLCEIALQAHDFVFTEALNDSQRARITPKWMGKVVKALLTKPTRLWKAVLPSYLSELGGQSEGLPGPSKAAISHQDGLTSPDLIGTLIRDYNQVQGLTHFGPYFPTYQGYQDLTLKVINHVLNHGQLISPDRILHPDYAALLGSVPNSQRNAVRRKLDAVKEIARSGRYWLRFFDHMGIDTLDKIEVGHGKSYIAWRKVNRFHGSKTLPISSNILKKELTYFRNACQFAIQQKKLVSNPFQGACLSRMEPRLETNRNLPLSIQEVRSIIDKLQEKLSRSNKRKEEIRWNLYMVLFLICTGCRPNEASKWSITGDYIQFHKRNTNGTIGGKTRHAFRKIPLTDTLRFIINEISFQNSSDTIVSRLHRHLRRLGVGKINPYRLRHTTCSLLWAIGDLTPAEIAYRMGHQSPDFSYRVYGEMGTYLGSGISRENLREFWARLNSEILS